MSEGGHSTREVKTEFTAEDKGLRATLAAHAHAFENVAHHTETLRERVRELRREQGYTAVAALGLGYGIGSWLEKAKEANLEFANATKGVAGVLSSSLEYAKGTSEIDRYRGALELAKEVTEEADETAARFGMQMDGVVTIYKKLALAAGGLGLEQEQVKELMVSTAATAARFGVSGEMAASTIARALKTGAIRGVDEFSISLGRAVGNMRKMTQAQRFDHIQKALQGSVQVADEMSKDIGGALARIRNIAEDTFRDLTKPIFGEVAKRLESWGKHLREARAQGKPLIEEFSGKLLSAFKMLADISSTLREHWVSIGAVVAGMKVGGLATSIAGALGNAAGALGSSGALGYAGGLLKGAGGGLGVIGQLAPALGGIVTAAALASIALKGVYDEWQGRKKQASELGDFFKEMGKVAETRQYMRKHAGGLTTDQEQTGKEFAQAHAAAAAEVLKQKGLFENGAIAMEKFNGVVDAMSDDVRINFAKALGLEGLGSVSSGMLGAAAAELLSRNLQSVAGPSKADQERKFAKQVVNNNFNGGIHVTWKNEEQDPDRAFVRFTDKLENYVHNRTQAATAEALGD